MPRPELGLLAVGTLVGDEACRELLEVHSAFYGPQDEQAFFAEMIARRRLVIRLGLEHIYGVIATGGRRPLPAAQLGAARSPANQQQAERGHG